MPLQDIQLPPDDPAHSRPLLVFLHFLGGSAKTWGWMTAHLADRFRCLTMDLPGFGDSARLGDYTVGHMADAVARAVEAEAPSSWGIVGHSMGAKLAAILARRAEDGQAGLAGLSHLVLLAGSPPSPEPMEEEQRATMLGWFEGGDAKSREQAQAYIDGNVGASLDPAMNDRVTEDVLRMDRAAWLAWLDGGSREDWSQRVGVLQTPALIVAGEHDAALGPDAQASLMAPHFTACRLVTLAGARHLLPMERDTEVAGLIVDAFARRVRGPEIPPDYRVLIDSDRVSARTRSVLLERGRPDRADYAPQALTLAAYQVLEAVVDRVLPQHPDQRIDLAARIDGVLADEQGDGWRFALLPADREAYDAALRTLDAAARTRFGDGYATLDPVRQDSLLETAAAGTLEGATGDAAAAWLSAAQMKLWFEDLRADAVRAYVGHPATLARIGFSGIANGGDGPRKQGFVEVGGGQREPWETLPAEVRVP